MEFGSPKEHIQEVVLKIFNQCRLLNIRLQVKWRSREDPAIQYADQGSRWFDESSYGLNFDSFYFLVSQFSHLDLDVDCMAQRSNKKCKEFFSRSRRRSLLVSISLLNSCPET